MTTRNPSFSGLWERKMRGLGSPKRFFIYDTSSNKLEKHVCRPWVNFRFVSKQLHRVVARGRRTDNVFPRRTPVHVRVFIGKNKNSNKKKRDGYLRGRRGDLYVVNHFRTSPVIIAELVCTLIIYVYIMCVCMCAYIYYDVCARERLVTGKILEKPA